MLITCFISCWLDLRGCACAKDMDSLFDLYGGVRVRFENAGLATPKGSAIAGILHEFADLDGEEEDGELSVLAVNTDGSLVMDDEGCCGFRDHILMFIGQHLAHN